MRPLILVTICESAQYQRFTYLMTDIDPKRTFWLTGIKR
jgi:hypothetical protein